jgi:hypothetical protein
VHNLFTCPNCGAGVEAQGLPANDDPRALGISLCPGCAALVAYVGGALRVVSMKDLEFAPPEIRSALARERAALLSQLREAEE